MLKAYKYRIYPNKEQEEQINKTFGCSRFVYNKTLAYRKEMYEKEKISVSKIDCNNYCNRELKKDVNVNIKMYNFVQNYFQKNVHFYIDINNKFALTNAIYNMDTAYQKFFKEGGGYPKFKSKHNNYK